MKRHERPIMNRAEMVDRWVYEIRARNLLVGVWNAQASGFIGIREKLGSLFLFTEYWSDPDSPVSTARAVELLGQVPEGVQLREYLPSTCIDCGKAVEHVEYPRGKPRGDQKGFQHTDGTPMEDTRQGSYGVKMHANPALFDVLVPFTQQVYDADRQEMLDEGFGEGERYVYRVWADCQPEPDDDD
jgi:hypothetical protein